MTGSSERMLPRYDYSQSELMRIQHNRRKEGEEGGRLEVYDETWHEAGVNVFGSTWFDLWEKTNLARPFYPRQTYVQLHRLPHQTCLIQAPVKQKTALVHKRLQ
jgi:hypothetical protein